MTSDRELIIGDIVLCPAGKARLIELNSRPDIREPPEEGLCKVEILNSKKPSNNEIDYRYFFIGQLELLNTEIQLFENISQQ